MYRPTIHLGVIRVSVVLAIGFGAGCQMDWSDNPTVSYPKADPMNLKVALILNKEFTDAQVAKDVTMRGVLGPSAEAMAKALFREVHVVESRSAALQRCDVIVVPRYGNWMASGNTTTVFLEWTASKPTGQLIWQQSVKGAGENWQPRRAFQAALSDAFVKSFIQMSSSPEIRKMAASKGVSEAAGP